MHSGYRVVLYFTILVVTHIVLFCFPAKTPIPSKETNTFYTSPLHLTAPAPLHMLHNGGRECEEMESRSTKLATHAGTRAVNQGQASQTAANAEKKKKKSRQKTPAGIFIAFKVFTCLSNASQISILHTS